MVVMRGINDDEMPDWVALTRDHPINVRFIEYMPFDGNVWSDRKMVPYREMAFRVQAALAQQHRHHQQQLLQLDSSAGRVTAAAVGGDGLGASSYSIPASFGGGSDGGVGEGDAGGQLLRRLADPSGEVAKNFQVPGHAGTISFVTSMTSHFCSDCNRCVLGGEAGGL